MYKKPLLSVTATTLPNSDLSNQPKYDHVCNPDTICYREYTKNRPLSKLWLTYGEPPPPPPPPPPLPPPPPEQPLLSGGFIVDVPVLVLLDEHDQCKNLGTPSVTGPNFVHTSDFDALTDLI